MTPPTTKPKHRYSMTVTVDANDHKAISKQLLELSRVMREGLTTEVTLGDSKSSLSALVVDNG